MNKTDLANVAKQIFTVEAEELIKASARIPSDVVKAADLIQNHDGKVVVCGLGKSGLIAQKIVATFCSTGTQAVFLHAAEALHGDLGIYHPGDPTILISKSGSTDEILRLVPILREFQSPLIGIIGNSNSRLAEKVDIVLDASVSREADPLGIVPTSSTTLTLAVGDALAAVLMSANGFKHDDFARYHPGGDLGKKLRLHIQDIMQPLEDCAVVNSDEKLRNVVIQMTEKPQGAALVLNENQSLSGIVTEGDLRRCLAENGDIDQLSAEEVMTKNPVSVLDTLPLSDAVSLMEDRTSQISVLPVMNENGLCTGLLRIHDIYQTTLP
ncbi:MAG: KpsF/GutQ family sugar-phosphate isomerase [Candidatus Marinimicrobia bacterium]|jgi:arabinose-5-phosphate isomerase|nr:KpsF/GutQ family sugar-phosphate isomerase [Candidatus Neomarinimicrobiota bacterium]MBT3617542.1 KpsF/GutQ family sugar-phosphate isomerase [Candidatus Neomarinimicrobiota bacterium]MBT3829219.1 KpsF/GutQ family sugar-phosphate isomerase [Candidatus Neomarinimicrobiota bacterium]MBT3996787.1 KpsF/GutQ family sugar-phosphate isomerase [Candidatus Neomarinimicrobiota bacterium]MBT4280343.1 KpsF/GutQ family sugar-phosphate isomerase [Candidatus Neomarinimicrobiota bacterium]